VERYSEDNKELPGFKEGGKFTTWHTAGVSFKTTAVLI